MKRLVALLAALTLVAACSSERSSTAGSTDTTDTTGTTTGDTTTGDTTPEPTADTTTLPTPTTVAEPTTTAACVPEGDIAPQSSDDPLLMSSLVGVDIRTGVHPCFERIVIELGGTGDFPGWTVQYVDDPVRLGESDNFVEIAGDATLQVVMRMWMPSMEGAGYTGPNQFVPESVFHILELRETENFEGICIWSIGLDAEYSFTVHVLQGPERLVIDVQVPPES
ncbi:MAG: hypothetical protein K8R99_01630 [Actinomycetia bacterium]|nr:hypothetical protein [Actinomycetes bacterium]